MKKISAKPISAQSWMLTEWGNRVGVLSAQDGSYTLLSSQTTETFSSQEALEKSLGWHITFEQLEAKEEPLDKIGVWPIKHTNTKDFLLLFRRALQKWSQRRQYRPSPNLNPLTSMISSTAMKCTTSLCNPR